jgi:hypothetical protein
MLPQQHRSRHVDVGAILTVQIPVDLIGEVEIAGDYPEIEILTGDLPELIRMTDY